MEALTLKPVVSFVKTHPANTATIVLGVAGLLAPFSATAWCLATAILLAGCGAANLPLPSRGMLDDERQQEDLKILLRIMLVAACYCGVHFMSAMPVLFPGTPN